MNRIYLLEKGSVGIRGEKKTIKIIETFDIENYVEKNGKISTFMPEKIIDDEGINRGILSYIKDILFDTGRIFSFPAERSGLAIFYNELLIGRNNIIDSFMREDGDGSELKRLISRYPKPVNDYINFLSGLTLWQLMLKKKNDFTKLANEIEKNFLSGKTKVKSDKKIIYETAGKELELYTSSSLVKTMVGVVIYLKYFAQRGNYFLIDEPELNLHPENQRKLARVFAQMINLGIRVVMTTHSPYLINELNNLIMLNKLSDLERKRIMKNNEIKEEEIVKIEDIASYFVKDNNLKVMNKGEFGLEVESFNETVDNLNNLSDDIYSSIEE